MISNCGIDEHGKIAGGQAGDQTGGEYKVRTWYNGSWTHVFRHHDAQVRSLIARKAIQAARNDLIGYDQSQRLTFWHRLQEYDYDPSKIAVACEADCSSSTAAIVKAVGIVLGKPSLAQIDPAMSTWVEVDAMAKAGFEVLTATKYRTSEANLLPGDILLKYGHTCIEVGSGNVNDFPEDDMPSVEDVWNYDGAMNKLNEINSRSSKLVNEVKEALAIINKPSVVIEFGGAFHRLYNQELGKHAYTNDEGHLSMLKQNGWTDDGVIFELGTSDTGGPVYMMVNQNDDTLFTLDLDEARQCAANGWATCGAIGFSGGDDPVYRLYNQYTGEHLFTDRADEYDSLKANGWTGEAIAFYSA